MSEDNADSTHTTVLGEVGGTEVRIVAEGPKARWWADVFASKAEGVYEDIAAQVREMNARHEATRSAEGE